jgi:hypothetical protein
MLRCHQNKDLQHLPCVLILIEQYVQHACSLFLVNARKQQFLLFEGWLTQEQIAHLFGKAKSTINEHIKNVFKEGELVQREVSQKFGISEFQQKAPIHYNLDVIISVG